MLLEKLITLVKQNSPQKTVDNYNRLSALKNQNKFWINNSLDKNYVNLNNSWERA